MPRQKKQILKRRADGRYCCKYHGIQFMGASSDEALDARDEYKRAEAAGELTRRPGLTVGSYALPWLKRTKVGVSFSTYNEAAGLLEKLLNHIADKPFSEVLPSDIKTVFSDEFAGFSDSYIRTAAILYRSLFDAAIADGLCRINPARTKAAKPHKGTKGGHRSITHQERTWIDTLCKDHRCRPAVMAMLYEGLRPPEAKAFNITDSVDADAGVIRLSAFAHKAPHGHYQITATGKTRNAAREIPLFTPFKNAIAGKKGQLIPTARGADLTATSWRALWQSYINEMEREINGMQKRWYRRTKAHKKILAEADKLRKEGKLEEAKNKEAEIPPWISFTVRPYDLRHSFCTMCRDAGVEMNTCIKWMGHADAKMIISIYDSVSAERSKTEAQKLEKSLIGMQNGMQHKVYRLKANKIKRLKV